MTGLSLRDAALEAGVSKSTIFRAIKAGRLSADRNDDGDYQIQPSELFRVYSPKRATHAPPGHDAPPSEPDETPALKAEIEGLKALVAVYQVQAESWQRQAEQALRLLTDQRPREPHRRWWPW